MGGPKVDDLVVDGRDVAGSQILAIYGRVSGVYAVYRTPERVVTHYADDAALGSDQRQALAGLNALKGEINGLVDGWRASEEHDQQSKARLFDRRVGDALIVGLQGDQGYALELLTAVKADILQERTSIARSQYLLAAAGMAVLIVILFSAITSPWFNRSVYGFDGDTNLIWNGAGVGAIGALFSVGIAIRDRSIGTDLQMRDNLIDAALRILIGAISGGIIVCLFRGGLVGIDLGGRSITSVTAGASLIATVIPFAGGFSERLVGDMLKRTVLNAAGDGAVNPLAGSATASPYAKAPPGSANETNPLGKHGTDAGAAPPAAKSDAAALADDHDEGCLCDHEVAEHELTHDVELPEAIGGVARA